jgi:hypothetical protein
LADDEGVAAEGGDVGSVGLLVRLTVYTGLRHSESFALEGADIDVASRTIAVDARSILSRLRATVT